MNVPSTPQASDRTTGQTLPLQTVLLLTPDDVARVLRTSRAAVYKMQERGQLPGVRRIGRRLLFDRAALLHWIGQNPTRH